MQGMLISIMALCIVPFSTFGQSVIINEISQGSDGGKEWVELLIVSEGTDIRGWELGDNDDGNWHSIATFTDHSDWSSLIAGTVIVLYNSGDIDQNIIEAGGEDTDFADKSVIIPINNTTYVSDTGPWGLTGGAFANSDGDDCPALRNATGELIHDMAVTHSTATVSSPGSGKVKYYTGNTVAGVTDDSNWVEATSSVGTPGETNGGDNSNWADQSLPVELSQWFASSKNDHVILQWTTASELENQGFIIERTKISNAEPVEAWSQIATFQNNDRLTGQGSTTNQHEYRFEDNQVDVGETYAYRLSDVDYNGKITKHQVITVTVKLNEPDLKPHSLTLHKAYPNPFNPDLNISFTLDHSVESLSLDIYNIQGVPLQQLAAGPFPEGTHKLTWDGTAFTSGIYFLRLTSANISQTQRITLLK